MELIRRKALLSPPLLWTKEGEGNLHCTYCSPQQHSKSTAVITTRFKTSVCNYRYLILWTSVWFVLGLKYLITLSHPRVNLCLSGRQVYRLIKLHNEIVRLTKLICHRQEYKSTIVLHFRVSNNPHQNYKPTWLTPCLVVAFQSTEITVSILYCTETRYLITYNKRDVESFPINVIFNYLQ